MPTDIRNYRRVSPWQMEVNDKVKYYDANGNDLGHLLEKRVLIERTQSHFQDDKHYPGAYELKFSKGSYFKRIYDDPDYSETSTFYEEPAKVYRNDDADEEIVFKPLNKKGGRNRKQSKRRKTSKKRKHRRKSIRRR